MSLLHHLGVLGRITLDEWEQDPANYKVSIIESVLVQADDQTDAGLEVVPRLARGGDFIYNTLITFDYDDIE